MGVSVKVNIPFRFHSVIMVPFQQTADPPGGSTSNNSRRDRDNRHRATSRSNKVGSIRFPRVEMSFKRH